MNYSKAFYILYREKIMTYLTIIEKEYIEISEYMQTSINILREFKEHIKNTLEQPYSNGVMERNNNTCKLKKELLLDLEIFMYKVNVYDKIDYMECDYNEWK